MLALGNIRPSVLYIGFMEEIDKIREIKELCRTLEITWEKENCNHMILFLCGYYGPRGSKLPNFEFDTNSTTFQRIMEEIIPYGFFPSSLIEKFNDLAKYYNFKYATAINRFPSNEFRDSLEDIGGINSHPFDVMLETPKSEISYCVPKWDS